MGRGSDGSPPAARRVTFNEEELAEERVYWTLSSNFPPEEEKTLLAEVRRGSSAPKPEAVNNAPPDSVYVMNSDFSSIDIENVNPSIARRDTIRLTDHQREFKQRRLAIYNFLDHPRSASNFPYHFGIFVIVLISVILGAVADANPERQQFYTVAFTMESILAVFFLLEFIVRIWSISADARYQGVKGLLLYLTRPVCMIDVLIIVATFGMLFMDRQNNQSRMMDLLRFVQILRLFHIDRQMTTWNMIRNMTIRSSFELIAAYYISSLIFMGLALGVYEVETYYDSEIRNGTDLEPTFNHYGDALWFSVISFLTVGYGDIVPKHWVSKLITCILAYAAYCTFVAASTLVSVGMTLMIENETKDKQRGKVRHAAATLIQHWYRYHLATHRKEAWSRIPYFKHVCFKLYMADERMKRSRQFAQKLREKYERAQAKKHQKAERSAKKNRLAHSEDGTLDRLPDWKESVARPLNFKAAALRKISIIPKSGSAPDCERVLRKEVSMPSTKHPPRLERRGSTSTSLSSSFDLSDIDKEIEIKQMLESQSIDSRRTSFDLNAIDEEVLCKYRPLIRFFNFLLFQRFIRKFKRIRKPYHLMDVETELCEMEHTRNQQFHELELKLEATIGKPATSPLHHNDTKLSIERRLEVCENYVDDLDAKANQLLQLAQMIGEAVGCVDVDMAVSVDTPDERDEVEEEQETEEPQ